MGIDGELQAKSDGAFGGFIDDPNAVSKMRANAISFEEPKIKRFDIADDVDVSKAVKKLCLKCRQPMKLEKGDYSCPNCDAAPIEKSGQPGALAIVDAFKHPNTPQAKAIFHQYNIDPKNIPPELRKAVDEEIEKASPEHYPGGPAKYYQDNPYEIPGKKKKKGYETEEQFQQKLARAEAKRAGLKKSIDAMNKMVDAEVSKAEVKHPLSEVAGQVGGGAVGTLAGGAIGGLPGAAVGALAGEHGGEAVAEKLSNFGSKKMAKADKTKQNKSKKTGLTPDEEYDLDREPDEQMITPDMGKMEKESEAEHLAAKDDKWMMKHPGKSKVKVLKETDSAAEAVKMMREREAKNIGDKTGVKKSSPILGSFKCKDCGKVKSYDGEKGFPKELKCNCGGRMEPTWKERSPQTGEIINKDFTVPQTKSKKEELKGVKHNQTKMKTTSFAISADSSLGKGLPQEMVSSLRKAIDGLTLMVIDEMQKAHQYSDNYLGTVDNTPEKIDGMKQQARLTGATQFRVRGRGSRKDLPENRDAYGNDKNKQDYPMDQNPKKVAIYRKEPQRKLSKDWDAAHEENYLFNLTHPDKHNKVFQELSEKLGREPTVQEHNAAFKAKHPGIKLDDDVAARFKQDYLGKSANAEPGAAAKEDAYWKNHKFELNPAKEKASMKVKKAVLLVSKQMGEGWMPMTDAELLRETGLNFIPELMKSIDDRPPLDWFQYSLGRASQFAEQPLEYISRTWYGDAAFEKAEKKQLIPGALLGAGAGSLFGHPLAGAALGAGAGGLLGTLKPNEKAEKEVETKNLKKDSLLGSVTGLPDAKDTANKQRSIMWGKSDDVAPWSKDEFESMTKQWQAVAAGALKDPKATGEGIKEAGKAIPNVKFSIGPGQTDSPSAPKMIKNKCLKLCKEIVAKENGSDSLDTLTHEQLGRAFIQSMYETMGDNTNLAQIGEFVAKAVAEPLDSDYQPNHTQINTQTPEDFGGQDDIVSGLNARTSDLKPSRKTNTG